MANYTGTYVKFRGPEHGWLTEALQRVTDLEYVGYNWNPIVFKFKLGDTVAAVGAGNTYTYGTITAPRGMYYVTTWIVVPQGMEYHLTSYNTYETEVNATPFCLGNSSLGIAPSLPYELTRIVKKWEDCSIAAGQKITFVVTAVVGGQPIYKGTEVWIVCAGI